MENAGKELIKSNARLVGRDFDVIPSYQAVIEKHKSSSIFLAVGDWSRHKAKIYEEIVVHTLADLHSYILSYPPSDEKLGKYFLRGMASYRSNDDMRTIEFLVIDGDCSQILNDEGKVIGVDTNKAPDPESVHTALKELGFNHILFPSWSNGQELDDGTRKVKWRLLIPCSYVSTKQELRDHTELAHRMLQDAGVPIQDVIESKVLSQAWFLTKPADSEWHTEDHYYFWDEGAEWNALQLQKDERFTHYYITPTAHRSRRVTGGGNRNIDFEEAQFNLKNGVNLHPTLVAIMCYRFNQGKNMDEVKEFLITEAKKSWSAERCEGLDDEIDKILEWLESQQ
nr:hypothetical protein 1 [Desulfobulbaceae bacterium]